MHADWSGWLTNLQNDIDLDFFCRAIIRADIARIQRISCPNVYLGSHHSGTHIRGAHDFAVDRETRVDAVFGACVFAEQDMIATDAAPWRSGIGGGRHI